MLFNARETKKYNHPGAGQNIPLTSVLTNYTSTIISQADYTAITIGSGEAQRTGMSVKFLGFRFQANFRPNYSHANQMLFKRYRIVIFAIRIVDSQQTLQDIDLDYLPDAYRDTYSRNKPVGGY